MACPLHQDPTTYVFRKVLDKPTHVIYYTHPSKVKHTYTSDEIISHYERLLRERGGREWTWVFDGSGFDTDHLMEVKTGQGIAQLLEGHNGDTLQGIHIINPSIHLKVLLKVIRPFMTEALEKKLNVYDDRPRSILEYL